MQYFVGLKCLWKSCGSHDKTRQWVQALARRQTAAHQQNYVANANLADIKSNVLSTKRKLYGLFYFFTM
jgi:hypothetical protein